MGINTSYTTENKKVKIEIECCILLKDYYEKNPSMIGMSYGALSFIRRGVEKLEKNRSEIKLHPDLASSVLEVWDFFKKFE